MDGYQYEYLIADYLKEENFRNIKVTKGSGDYGVDITAYKNGHKYAIQCKYYSKPVGIKAVQEVVAGKSIYNCDKAMVVTNSTYTNAAKELAKSNGVVLKTKVIDKNYGKKKRTVNYAIISILVLVLWGYITAFSDISINTQLITGALLLFLICFGAIWFSMSKDNSKYLQTHDSAKSKSAFYLKSNSINKNDYESFDERINKWAIEQLEKSYKKIEKLKSNIENSPKLIKYSDLQDTINFTRYIDTDYGCILTSDFPTQEQAIHAVVCFKQQFFLDAKIHYENEKFVIRTDFVPIEYVNLYTNHIRNCIVDVYNGNET